jgi:hypothetical protein
MWWGAVAGVAYAAWGFGPTGSDPRLCVTWGPFRAGRLVVGGVHVHHWVVYAALLPGACALGWPEAAGFCGVMVAHGLAYPDRFDFRHRAGSVTRRRGK